MTRLRPLIVTTVILSTAIVAGTTLIALRESRQPDRARQGRGGPPSLATVLDANHDGLINSDELAAAPAALGALDANHDGKLEGAELFAGGGRGGPGGRGGFDGRGPGGPGGRGGPEGRMGGANASADDLTETLMAFDKNADGKLVRGEVPERFQGLFDRADTNKDGSLTREEIKTSASAPAENQGPPEGGRGGRGGRGPMDPIVAALDSNHDGILSTDEIASAPQALRALDRNGDGQLSSEETRPAFGRGRGGDRDRNGTRDGDRPRSRVGALA